MPIYIVTGKLGAGKTLATVGRIKDYLTENRRVATNLNLNLNNLIGIHSKKCVVYRVPDKPTHFDIDALGLGYDGDYKGEDKNGGLFLDECATWFNSRTWNEEGRQELIELFRYIRKKRWDVYFIIQDLESLDKQARKAFAEHVVYCRRTDRFNIPIISALWKLYTDKPLPFPKVHIAFVKYGDRENSPQVDKWWYLGHSLYNAYDTTQIFSENSDALHTMLPPFYTHGRYTTRFKELKNAIRNLKAKSYHFFLLGALSSAFFVNALITYLPEEPKKGWITCNQTYKDLYGSCDAEPVLQKHKDLVKQVLDLKKNGKNKVIPSNTNEEINKYSLDGVYITGSVKSTEGFDYIFNKNQKSFYANEYGYKIKWVSSCKAILIKDDISTNIYCNDELNFTQIASNQ